MKDSIYDDMALEQIAKNQFGMSLDIDHVIVRSAPVGPVSQATLFLTKKKQLLLYVTGRSRITLGDVSKIVSRMGMVAELYIPPKGQPNYFDEVGKQHFKKVFPGRQNPTHNDLRYYRTLATYNPALVQISEVRTGEIKQYDSDVSTNWRTVAKFAYRRIKTVN